MVGPRADRPSQQQLLGAGDPVRGRPHRHGAEPGQRGRIRRAPGLAPRRDRGRVRGAGRDRWTEGGSGCTPGSADAGPVVGRRHNVPRPPDARRWIVACPLQQFGRRSEPRTVRPDDPAGRRGRAPRRLHQSPPRHPVRAPRPARSCWHARAAIGACAVVGSGGAPVPGFKTFVAPSSAGRRQALPSRPAPVMRQPAAVSGRSLERLRSGWMPGDSGSWPCGDVSSPLGFSAGWHHMRIWSDGGGHETGIGRSPPFRQSMPRINISYYQGLTNSC